MSMIVETDGLKAYYAIEIDGVKQYVRAVDDVSLSIEKDKILGIAGESGCGKSTLIKALYGLIHPPLTIVHGKVFYFINENKVNIFSLREDEVRRNRWVVASYIPQGSMSVLNPTVKIRSQFLDVIKAHQKDVDKKEAEKLIEKHILELGLPVEVLNSYPHQLSGGMRQRAVIALATILKPKIIFADEPTTALDVIVQRGVIQMLLRVRREFESTLILVTHNMGIHAQVTDRMAIMYAGKIVELATTEEIFENPLHPYTRYLISSLPKIGDKSKKIGISGRPPSLLNPPSGCRFHTRCPIAKAICNENVPPLTEMEPDHYVSCHFGEKN